MKNWSISWKSSIKAKKQRKYRFNAPIHIKRKFVGAHLSKELKQKYNRRNIQAMRDDKVKVVRGRFKGHKGKIEKVDMKSSKLIITGIEIQKKDGTKAIPLIDPSNIIITELNLDDKKRHDIIDRKKKRDKNG